jgi:hypothetical protein
MKSFLLRWHFLLMCSAWATLCAVTSVVSVEISGWTLLHVYRWLFFCVIAIFYASYVVIPLLSIVGLVCVWKSRISVVEFFLTVLPFLAVSIGSLSWAYYVESARYH